MLFSLLLAALPVASSTSSEVSAASNVRHTQARLLDSGAPIVFVDAEEGGDFPPIEQMTREQLQREYDRLDSERPSLGGSIGLLAGGAAAAIVGLIVIDVGSAAAVLSTSGSTATSFSMGTFAPFLVAGLLLIAAGATLAIIGGIKLAHTIRERRRYSVQQDAIRERLEGNPANPYPAPPPGEGVPPPPPPPPSVHLTPMNAVERLTLASF